MFNREPILWLAAVQGVIALVTSFGLNMTGEQTGAIMAVTAAVLGLVARQRVSPVVPPAPAHRDVGASTLELIALIVVTVLAMYALYVIFA